jgi:isopenicillin N synthase-like dioxygenase
LGKPHWDRDANTFQFYESCPGLEGRTRRDGWFPISSAPNRPWLFNGGKAEVATGGLMERAGHRIRRYKDLPPFSPRIARVSQMGFMHLHSLTVPSEWNTHQLKF